MWSWVIERKDKILLACKIWEMIVFCFNGWLFLQQKIWFLCASRSECILTRQLTYSSTINITYSCIPCTMFDFHNFDLHSKKIQTTLILVFEVIVQPHGNIFWHFQVRPKSWKSHILRDCMIISNARIKGL